ncbi:hypothetical protein M8T88_05230 [Enterobacter hormaechei]|uniref:hypothetical protein n=1 Tax=Enterobacter hormaechei TaxID=158836 RepID=UPI001E646993|nr:hypothetical protein [Enterobacter hormaechei]MCM7740780.1 hypothetical protein [Enterobacter hormaechei]MDV5366201.1 hypothetical protein [Enterobacter hormaechei]
MSTITREFTKEQLQQIIETDHVQCGEASSLARIALASLEAEAVCVIDQSNLDYLKSGSDADVWPASRAEMGDVLLYRAAPPAPVSVPDERYQHLSELYHAQEKRLFKLAQRIKGASFDKYAYSPSQAIDVLESAIFGEREDECRAAILHGADRPQNEPQNIPENIPATQFEPVADLYGLTSPTGSETSFTFDAVEARDFIDGGWSCQEYVELGRFQEAVSGNSPVIPDGWVAVPVEPTIAILDEFDSIIDYGAEDSKDAWSRLLAAAWIKSLPAAPQQEVESQIRKGKTVAREEWELGRG